MGGAFGSVWTPLPPLGHIWDVILVCRKGNIEKTVSVLQYCVLLQWRTKVRAVLTGRSTVSGFDLVWFSSRSSERLRSSSCCICILNNILLTSLTNHRPAVLWHCWLGHLTRKIVSKMTYNVLNGTLNPTILLGLFVGSVILCDGIREWWRSHVSNPTNAQVWRAADTFLCRGGYAGINVSPSAWHHLQVL